jgi:hypothetical protein
MSIELDAHGALTSKCQVRGKKNSCRPRGSPVPAARAGKSSARSFLGDCPPLASVPEADFAYVQCNELWPNW